MRSEHRSVGAFVLLVLLAAMLFPALTMGLRVAPEVSLKSAAPWRLQWGPHPSPSPLAVEAATVLGPRLASISRDGLSVAVWNPFIGGGRPGWLSSAAEGGAPLVLAAGFGARPGWTWTALVALELTAAFGSAFWVLTLLEAGGWAAAAGALAYALSGAVASQLLGVEGTAVALGPLALVAALRPWRTLAAHAAGWFAALVLLVPSGPAAVPFVALGGLAEVFRPGTHRPVVPRAAAAALGLAMALAFWAPSFWLQREGVEPGARLPLPRPVPALSTARALVVPFPSGDPASPETFAGGTAGATARGEGFLGAGVLLLAALGALGSRRDGRILWLGVALFAGAAAFLPARWLLSAGVTQRPLAVLALSTAALAALGVRWLLDRVPRGWRAGTGALVCAVLMMRMIPPAAHRLPYAGASDALLASPLSPAETAGGVRLAALLDTIPPDVSATLGVRDVRALDFRAEPRYARLLEEGADGELSPSHLLDPSLAALGAALILEPLPLRVVSGEIFSRIETAPLTFTARSGRTAVYAAPVPRGATRVGLPAPMQNGAEVRLEGPDGQHVLAADPTLAGESSAWTWFAVPRGRAAAPSELTVTSQRLWPPGLAVAWDRSGLRLERESLGVRIWSWDLATPVASLAAEIVEGSPARAEPGAVTLPAGSLAALGSVAPVAGGHAGVAEARPGLLRVSVAAPAPALLLAQVKYRPALWSVTVDGAPVATVRADGVWTGVPVAAGAHDVTLRARLPLRVWLVSAAASLGFLGLALLGRKERP